jgi:uncharacterized protein
VPHSPFRLTVPDLLRDHGRQRAVQFEVSVDWGLELSRLDRAQPLRAQLTVEGVSGGIHLRGLVEVGLTHICNRCLKEWGESAEVEINEFIGADPEFEYRILGDQIDLEPPIRDAVLLSLPLLPLCQLDCRGLCAVCGADLNIDSCPGHDEETGSPFVALRDLLEP